MKKIFLQTDKDIKEYMEQIKKELEQEPLLEDRKE